MKKIFSKIVSFFQHTPLYVYFLISYLSLMLYMVFSLVETVAQSEPKKMALYAVFILLFLLFILLIRYFNKTVVCFFAILTFLFFPTLSYIYYNGFVFNPFLFNVILNTSFSEALHFFASMAQTYSFRIIILSYLLPIFICLCLFLVLSKQTKKASFMHYISLFLLFILMIPPLIFAFDITAKKTAHTEKTYTYIRENPQDNEQQIIVFMLGESLRADHFGINGYLRDTTPLLSKEKNLISFKNAHASRLDTVSAFKTLMSNYDSKKSMEDFKMTDTIFALYSQLYYETALISTNITTSLYQLYEKDLQRTETHFLSGYDEKILPVLKDFINSSNKNKFALLHTYSGHYTYQQTVPDKPQFKKFNQISSQKIIQSNACNCSWSLNGKLLDKIVNDYDNAVVYSDFVIDSVIDMLRDKNAFLIFTSDHGESFGERGQPCLHLFDVPEVWNVPLIVWASDKWIAKHPAQWQAVNQALIDEQENKRNVSHRNIIASLLDCNNIQTDYIDTRFSLCSQIFEPDFFEGCNRFELKDCLPCKQRELLTKDNTDFLKNITPAENKIKDMPTFKERVFIHGVNSPLVMKAHLFEYTNFEIDVFIQEGAILTGHNPYQKEEAYLEDILQMLPDTGQNVFWLDVKNLNHINKDSFLTNLEALLKKYHIQNSQVIVESPAVEFLDTFREHGFITSFYFAYENAKNLTELQHRVQRYNQHPTSCISSDINFISTVQYLFPNHCLLFWNVQKPFCQAALDEPNTQAVILDVIFEPI